MRFAPEGRRSPLLQESSGAGDSALDGAATLQGAATCLEIPEVRS
jgi:hypothetical protein